MAEKILAQFLLLRVKKYTSTVLYTSNNIFSIREYIVVT